VAIKKGTSSSDLLSGTDSADFIYAYGGDDVILAGLGNDYIEPGLGNNFIFGGDGNDTISYSDYVPPWFANLHGVEVDLAAGKAWKHAFSYNPNWDPAANQTDSFSSIENIVGSNYDDSLYGDANANSLWGWGGNDELVGRNGDDSLFGEGGDDTLAGGSGADELNGSAGVDEANYGDSPAGVHVSLYSGSIGSGGDAEGDTLFWIENLTGSDYADVLLGDDNANVLAGGKSDDWFKGGGGADTLEGGDGSDTIAYGDSNIGVYVSLYSGAAFNGTATGDQFDSIENLTGSYHDDMLEGDEYVNTLQGLGGDDVLQGYGDADTINGGDGIDTVTYGGSVLGVTVSLFNGVTHGGDAEGDTLISIENLRGSGYADTLVGNNDANVLEGWGGKDNLKGAGGADTLVGGAAADQMTGGAGGDKFVLEALSDSGTNAANMDVIADFNAAELDSIDVHSIDANATLAGNQAFTFIEDDAFSAPGQIRYYHNGVDTFIELNTGNDLAADAAIHLSGLHTPEASWFVL
jgi:Ca2+-binding RTX toxin-like protein